MHWVAQPSSLSPTRLTSSYSGVPAPSGSTTTSSSGSTSSYFFLASCTACCIAPSTPSTWLMATGIHTMGSSAGALILAADRASCSLRLKPSTSVVREPLGSMTSSAPLRHTPALRTACPGGGFHCPSFLVSTHLAELTPYSSCGPGTSLPSTLQGLASMLNPNALATAALTFATRAERSSIMRLSRTSGFSTVRDARPLIRSAWSRASRS
mmetsp:Transcript_18055/g.38847  ORF Transcript_18055/g.38847 Transcript_18055/m.38847 type:complete len:211 (-) Transcript_18055:200-832(-)